MKGAQLQGIAKRVGLDDGKFFGPADNCWYLSSQRPLEEAIDWWLQWTELGPETGVWPVLISDLIPWEEQEDIFNFEMSKTAIEELLLSMPPRLLPKPTLSAVPGPRVQPRAAELADYLVGEEPFLALVPAPSSLVWQVVGNNLPYNEVEDWMNRFSARYLCVGPSGAFGIVPYNPPIGLELRRFVRELAWSGLDRWHIEMIENGSPMWYLSYDH
jgi:hypothetical protein